MKYIKKSGYLQIMEVRHGLYALLLVIAALVVILLTQPDQYASDEAKFTWLFLISLMVAGGFFLARMLVIRSDKFSSGIKAENIVRKALRQLDDRFTVIHNFPLPKRGDIDFVVVGPTGIFCVEVKRRKMPSYAEMDKFAYQVRRQADGLRYFIEANSKEKSKVKSIVVLVDVRGEASLGDRGEVFFTIPAGITGYILTQDLKRYVDEPALLSAMKRA